jgi:hypothetical protein
VLLFPTSYGLKTYLSHFLSPIDYVQNTRDAKIIIPDMTICKFTGAVGHVGAVQDIVRIVVEVGSWPHRTGKLFDYDLKSTKTRIRKQLRESMETLGASGDRWEDKVLGIGIIGTLAAFMTWDDGEWKWYNTGDENLIWFSIYSKMWAHMMDKFTNTF